MVDGNILGITRNGISMMGGVDELIAPTFLSHTTTFHNPTVTTITSLSANKLTVTPALYNPTITPGSVTIGANKLTHTPIFPFPSISTSTSISHTTLTHTPTFYNPTVTPGVVSADTLLLSHTPTFNLPTILTGDVGILIPTLTLPIVVSQPDVSTYTPINPSFYSNPATIHAPVIEPGAVSVSTAYLTNPPVVHSPTIEPGPFSLVADYYSHSIQTFIPSIAVGAVNIQVNFLNATPTVFDHSVGLVPIQPQFLTITPNVFDPEATGGVQLPKAVDLELGGGFIRPSFVPKHRRRD